jgi:hypothetical protein
MKMACTPAHTNYRLCWVLTARLSGQQVMINGNTLHAPSSSRLRSLSARNPGPRGAPAARRGRTTWTAARMSAVSWVCPLAVAKKVRPSQKVTGLLHRCAIVPRRSPIPCRCRALQFRCRLRTDCPLWRGLAPGFLPFHSPAEAFLTVNSTRKHGQKEDRAEDG